LTDSSKTKSVHYRISPDVIKLVEDNAPATLRTKSEVIEYYLRQGVEYDKQIKDQHNIEVLLGKNISDIRYIKKLLIQMFVNSNFQGNMKVKDSEVYFDFVKAYSKSDLSD
jgi:hypothetical protein